jgi:hypothetical protein
VHEAITEVRRSGPRQLSEGEREQKAEDDSVEGQDSDAE